MAARPDLESLSSEALLRAFRRRGDVAAIGVLFDREAPGLYRLALALCRDPQTAEDVLQETFLAALDGLEGFDERRPLGPYLVGILRNMVRRAGRERSRRPDLERLARRLDEQESPLADDEREAVRRALDTLEEPYRAVALLHYVHGLSPGEIAHLRSEPPGTVRSLLSRARARLRGRLAVVPALLLAGPDPRGLDAVRLAVLERASSLAAASVTTAALGGILVGKKVVLALAAVALVLVGLGLSLGIPGSRLGREEPADTPDLRAENAPGDEAADASLRGTGEADATATALARATPPAEAHAAGHVLDAEGHPIAGARVLVVPEAETTPIGAEDVQAGRPGALAVSDGDGRFFVSLDATHPAHTLLVEAPGYAPRALRAVTPGADVEVVLEAPAAIAGRVVNRAGEPVAGATVTFLGALDAASVLRIATSDTEGRYRIEDLPVRQRSLPDVACVRMWLRTEAEGYAPLVLEGELQRTFALRTGETLERDLTLVRGATLKGIVEDAETGVPLPQAEAVLISIETRVTDHWGDERRSRSPWGERVVARTTSDAEGSFVIAHVPARGVHRIASHNAMGSGRLALGSAAAFLTGYVPNAVSVPVVDDGVPIEVVIALWPAAEVVGRVVDPEGRALSKASVGIQTEERPTRVDLARLEGYEGLPVPWTATDDEGRFHLTGVPALRARDAEAVLLVSEPTQLWSRRVPRPRPITVRAGRTTDLGDVVLQPDARFSYATVRVLDAAGVPVPDAFVRYMSRSSGGERTDAAGVARIALRSSPQHPLSPRRYVVSAAGHATTRFEIDPEGLPEIEVRLGVPHSIAGRVFHEDGSPWPGVWIAAAPVDRSEEDMFREDPQFRLDSYEWMATAGSDEQGRFTLRDLPEGTFYVEARVTLYGGGKALVTRALRADVPAGTDGLELVVPSLEVPTGTSLDVDVVAAGRETGVEGASLALQRAGVATLATAVGPGRYRFEAVQPGRYTLRVWCSGFVPVPDREVEVEGGVSPDPIRVVLDPGGRVVGRVTVDPACGDVKGWSVRAVPVQDGDWEDAVFSDPLGADGRFILAGLRPGAWTVSLNPPRDLPLGPWPVREGARPIDVPTSGAEVALDLHFVAGGFLATVVSDPRLPPEGASNPPAGSAEARAWEAFGKDAVLRIRTEDGRTVASSRGLRQGSGVWAAYLSLPPGVWVVRLEIGSEAPQTVRAEVRAGETTTVTIPEPR